MTFGRDDYDEAVAPDLRPVVMGLTAGAAVVVAGLPFVGSDRVHEQSQHDEAADEVTGAPRIVAREPVGDPL